MHTADALDQAHTLARTLGWGTCVSWSAEMVADVFFLRLNGPDTPTFIYPPVPQA